MILYGAKLKLFLSLKEELESHNSTLKMENSFLRDRLSVVEERLEVLTNTAFQRIGLTTRTDISPTTNTNNNEIRAIGGKQSWARTRQQLETMHRPSSVAKIDSGTLIKELDDLISLGEKEA